MSLDIQVDGVSAAELRGRWRALTVVDGIDYQADSATLSLVVPAALEIELPPLGAELRFAVDDDDLGGPLHATAIHGDNRTGSVAIEAGALHPLTTLREPRKASWSGQSIAQIATAIAERAGLVPAISATLGSKVPAGAIQSDESDEQFLRRLVARWSGRVVHKNGRLAVLPADETKSASGVPLPPVEINLRTTGAWVRWRRSETAIVDIVQATHLEADGATPTFLTLGELPQGRRPQRRKLPGRFRVGRRCWSRDQAHTRRRAQRLRLHRGPDVALVGGPRPLSRSAIRSAERLSDASHDPPGAARAGAPRRHHDHHRQALRIPANSHP